MKTVYTTYKIELLDPDFLDGIDPEEHWTPMERTTLIDGNETLKELLDENGEVYSWSETVYNSDGFITDIKEWSAGEKNPDKHQMRVLVDNRLVREESWFRAELTHRSNYEYDPIGRLIKVVRAGEGDKDTVAHSFYNKDSADPHTEEYWLGEEKWQVINYLYEDIRGKWELIEERKTVLNDLDQSRITRYFYHGLGPNNAVEKIYNRNEKLLEEIREYHNDKEQMIRREYHTSDSQFSEPFQVEVIVYNEDGTIQSSTTVAHGVRTHSTQEWYDEKGRVIRTHAQLHKESNMYFHVYED